jgi:hypothetical protein
MSHPVTMAGGDWRKNNSGRRKTHKGWMCPMEFARTLTPRRDNSTATDKHVHIVKRLYLLAVL